MGTEERLARLGLLHLRNDPEALQAELERRSAAYQAEVDEWNRQRGELPAAKAPAAPVDAPTPRTARIEIERLNAEGPKRIDTFERDQVRIGRYTDNDLRLTSRIVSKHHAVVSTRDGNLFVRDAGSTSGLLANGKRVQTTDMAIDSGTTLEFAEERLRVFLRVPSSSPPPASDKPWAWLAYQLEYLQDETSVESDLRPGIQSITGPLHELLMRIRDVGKRLAPIDFDAVRELLGALRAEAPAPTPHGYVTNLIEIASRLVAEDDGALRGSGGNWP